MKPSIRGKASSSWVVQNPSRATYLLSIAIGLAVVLTGCEPPKPHVATAAKIDGKYQLASVDGKPVPCQVGHEQATLTIKGGQFTIAPDGTCDSSMQFTAPNGKDAERAVQATYTAQGSELTMKWKGAGTTKGTVNGNTFTMNNEGMVLRYEK